MKLRNLILSCGVLLIINELNAQVIITKNDSIPIGNDSIVKIVLPEVRGSIQWQQSFDKNSWNTSINIVGDTLIVPVNFNAYYRAKIIEDNCTPVFSDTIRLKLSNSTWSAFADSIFEIAYPDSVGENRLFIINDDSIICEKINNEYVLEGDIILTEEQLLNTNGLKGAGIPSGIWCKRWPENKIYYSIDNKLVNDIRITDAIKHWEEKTLIRFIKKKDESNYIEFVWDAKGCSSYIGMKGGSQKIKIADWGKTGNVIHEIGHAVGLLHEQSRSDRDKYITIIWDNIQSKYKSQYRKRLNSINTDDFDFSSIMLYPGMNTTFAIDIKKPTIIKKSNGLSFDAQRISLSLSDIEIIKMLYASEAIAGSFTDTRDGHEYKTIKIGEQVWMAENLAYLPMVYPSSNGLNTEPRYYVYDYQGTDVAAAKQNANYTTYGVLYNWSAAKAACPPGWHLPSDAEWTALENYLTANGYNYDGTTAGNKIAKSLAATTNWITSSDTGAIGNNLTLNNKSGFSAFPGGYRNGNGNFSSITNYSNWWSSTEYSSNSAWGRGLGHNNSHLYRGSYYKQLGFSVRCVRDK